jgi:outer membrane protein TolC
MVRNVCSIVVVVAVCTGWTARAAAPPSEKTPLRARRLSLAEAMPLALRHQAAALESHSCCDWRERQRKVAQLLLNVEVAYWNLYGSHWTLQSREQGMNAAFEAFKLTRYRYEAGRATQADLAQARGQYELFRAQRLQAIDMVVENERQLRALLGMANENSTRLIPSDSPTLAPIQPDWHSALQQALARRPEILMTRDEVKAAQFNLLLVKNSLRPDLRAVGSYDFNGLGTRIDGPDSAPPNATTASKDVNAFRNLASGNFSNWSISGRRAVPTGYRIAIAEVRQAQLTLARAMETLKDQELKAQRFLARYYRQLSTNYETIRAQRAQREAFADQLKARQQEFLAGRGTLDVLLEAQRFWADALANEYQAIVSYNNSLAGFAFGRGASLQRKAEHDARFMASVLSGI